MRMHVLDEGEKGLGCQTGDSTSHAGSRLGLHLSGFQLKLPNRLCMKKGFHCFKEKGVGLGELSHLPTAILAYFVEKFGFHLFDNEEFPEGFKTGKGPH